jgi:predicted transcriptional regulator
MNNAQDWVYFAAIAALISFLPLIMRSLGKSKESDIYIIFKYSSGEESDPILISRTELDSILEYINSSDQDLLTKGSAPRDLGSDKDWQITYEARQREIQIELEAKEIIDLAHANAEAEANRTRIIARANADAEAIRIRVIVEMLQEMGFELSTANVERIISEIVNAGSVREADVQESSKPETQRSEVRRPKESSGG